MALVVEDGTGKTTAESYIAVADANTYHTARGNSTWTGEDGVKEAALRKATAYLDGRYRDRWRGKRSTKDQALAWPRLGGVDSDGYGIDPDSVPAAVAYACAELARLVIEGVDLTPTLERGGRTTSESVKVGPIEESKTYASSAPVRSTLTIVDDLLGAVLSRKAASGSAFLDRA